MSKYALGNGEFVLLLGGTVICAASAPAVLPLWGVGFLVQYLVRRTAGFDRVTRRLLPPAPLRLLGDGSAPDVPDTTVDAWLEDVAAPAQADDLSGSVRRLPKLVPLRDLRLPAARTAVPLGVDAAGQPHWVDLQDEVLHIGLYGQTNAGKDNLLRCWFILLTKRNSPERVQFLFLDAKADWLTANLAGLAHMWQRPAGGYGKAGDDAILAAIETLDTEAARRQQVITAAGCRTREQYEAKTGQVMPLLVVVLTDVMGSIAGRVEQLLEILVSKARALGIRVIVSMQTPTGRSQRWRMNLSCVLAGNLQDRSQDAPALGLPEKALRYRPSQLPPSRKLPGVFVVRSDAQVLVKAPFLPDDDFDRLVAGLPTTPAAHTALLSSLLGVEAAHEPGNEGGNERGNDAGNGQGTTAESGNGVTSSFPPCTRDVTSESFVTSEAVTGPEIARIAALLSRGNAASDVAKKLPGYSPKHYTHFKRKVDSVKRMLDAMPQDRIDDLDLPTDDDDDVPPPFRSVS